VQRGDFLAESKNAAGGKLRGRFGLHFQFAFLLCSILLSAIARGDDAASTSNPLLIYEKLKAFSVGYGSVRAENLVLKRDRVTITFRDGTLYFPPPIDGKVFGAVFIGTGSFQADVPPNQFEREDVRRLLKSDEVSSDFKTAVLRFTDDSYSLLGERSQQGAQAPEAATKLAAELDRRVPGRDRSKPFGPTARVDTESGTYGFGRQPGTGTLSSRHHLSPLILLHIRPRYLRIVSEHRHPLLHDRSRVILFLALDRLHGK
jgi:hypothetical protein